MSYTLYIFIDIFKHLTVVDMQRRLVDKVLSQNRFRMSDFFIECLFEAKSIEYFNSSIRAIPSFHMLIQDDVSAFVMYALGYCIANIHTGKPWCLHMTLVEANMFGLLESGLKTNAPCVGVIKEVLLGYCKVSLANIMQILFSNCGCPYDYSIQTDCLG